MYIARDSHILLERPVLGGVRILSRTFPLLCFDMRRVNLRNIIAYGEGDEMPRHARDISILGSDVEILQRDVYTPRKASNSDSCFAQIYLYFLNASLSRTRCVGTPYHPPAL